MEAIAVGLAFAVAALTAVQVARHVAVLQLQERQHAELRQLQAARQELHDAKRAAELWRWNHPAQRDRGTLKA